MGNFASKTKLVTNDSSLREKRAAPTTPVKQCKTRSQTLSDNGNFSNSTVAKKPVSAARTSKKRTRDENATKKTRPPRKKAKRTHKTWDERYEDLRTFHNKYGHAVVPSSPEYISLANWLYVQKKRTQPGYYRCSKLSKGQVAKLNKLGVDWTIGRHGGGTRDE